MQYPCLQDVNFVEHLWDVIECYGSTNRKWDAVMVIKAALEPILTACFWHHIGSILRFITAAIEAKDYWGCWCLCSSQWNCGHNTQCPKTAASFLPVIIPKSPLLVQWGSSLFHIPYVNCVNFLHLAFYLACDYRPMLCYKKTTQ